MKLSSLMSNQITVHSEVQGSIQDLFPVLCWSGERVGALSISMYGLMLSEFDEIFSQVADTNYLGKP